MTKLMRKCVGKMISNTYIKSTIKKFFGKTKLYSKLQNKYYGVNPDIITSTIENQNHNQQNNNSVAIQERVVYRDAEIENTLRNMSMDQLRIFLDVINNENAQEEYSDASCN